MYRYFLILLFILGCSAEPYRLEIIRIKGSDTMLILTRKLADEYMNRNPGTSIYVEGGGTSNGIKSMIKGEVDICTASRLLKAEEAKLLADYYGTLGMYFLLAKDALSIYLNPANPVKNLTRVQLKEIFTCKIKNWSELGGNDENIIILNRMPNSGTYLYFQEHVLDGEEYCTEAEIYSTTEAVIEAVEDNINAIGYGGIGFGEDVYHATVDNVEPTEENARNDTYPITRYLHFFTSKSPTGKIKDFIDWVLTPEGQKIIRQEGYIPLWEISF
ncbi:MAG: phosphate ABC transporter substrate-binding protein [Bacteroidetes bacterium]|nr:phosphate ABC transporter substrate-binding protein [Bacteroidota bacterium]